MSSTGTLHKKDRAGTLNWQAGEKTSPAEWLKGLLKGLASERFCHGS